MNLALLFYKFGLNYYLVFNVFLFCGADIFIKEFYRVYKSKSALKVFSANRLLQIQRSYIRLMLMVLAYLKKRLMMLVIDF